MTPKQIVTHIKTMRDRDALSEIIDAAEARDQHLSNIESDERRKRAWSHFSHLRKGDTVFVHEKPSGTNAALYGQPLTVVDVKPKLKEIVVVKAAAARGEKVKVKLTALMALSYKLSEEPTSAAFANSLVPEDTTDRTVRSKPARIAPSSLGKEWL